MPIQKNKISVLGVDVNDNFMRKKQCFSICLFQYYTTFLKVVNVLPSKVIKIIHRLYLLY